MILKINKNTFTKHFLEPVSRISEECSIQFNSNSITALVSDLNGEIILHSSIESLTGLPVGESIKLNFKDLRKLIKIIDCIPLEDFELDVDDNSSVIKHKSHSFSFKLHLVLDSIIKRCAINLDRINKLVFDSDFTIDFNKIKEILKGSAFNTASNKIYFFSKDGNIYAELTDKSKDDTDSLMFNVTDSFNGADISTPLPFKIETLRLLISGISDLVTVRVNNTYKILLFEINNGKDIFRYIVPAYTK